MPQHYSTRPAMLETLRCLIVRGALSATFTLFWLVTRMLPAGHPVRVFSTGRVTQLRETVLPATVPASNPSEAAVARSRRTWLAWATLAATLIACDTIAGIPIDAFGIPDVNLGLGAASNGAHLLSLSLPWDEASRMTVALLAVTIGALYALRPRAATLTD